MAAAALHRRPAGIRAIPGNRWPTHHPHPRAAQPREAGGARPRAGVRAERAGLRPFRFFFAGRHNTAAPFVLSVNPSTFTRGDFMSQPRLNWTDIAPKSYKAMAGVNATLSGSTLGPILMDLIPTRVSQ